jgi:hypothetical protein
MFKRLFVLLPLAPFLPQTFGSSSIFGGCGGQTNDLAAGDGVDWIDPSYVKSYPSRKNLETAKAARGIVNRARSSAKNGPFSGFHVLGVLALF